MNTLRRVLDKSFVPENNFLVLMAVGVGIGAALLGLIFRYTIDLFTECFFSGGRFVFGGFLNDYYIVLLPFIGGLLVGPLIYFCAKEAKGHGVPEVMAAVAVKGGKIRPRIVLVKCLASALTIGSGGSAGAEGPIVQIGSGFGSTIAQVFHLSEERMKTLVCCGAAAGIATVFNAPIAGVFFALEVISGQFSTSFFSLTVLSSVTASVIARAVWWGNSAVFAADYSLVDYREIFIYVVLGMLAGIFAVFEIKFMYYIEHFFERLNLREYFKPALGGLLVGLIGLQFPEILGTGYGPIQAALAGKLAFWLLAALVFVKLLAVSLTLGSGGSGGVFAPSLFMGAMLGGMVGIIANSIFPQITANPGAYALVGMGAVFAGAARAPITSMIMLFEMTNDYRIILPLMGACVTSYIVANHLFGESIYTLKLKRRGINLRQGIEKGIIESLSVADVMTKEVETASANINVSEMNRVFERSRHMGFPVLQEGQLVGIITYLDIRKAHDQGLDNKTVGEIMNTELMVTFPDENLSEALKKFGLRGIGRLPVVDRNNHAKIEGILTRTDIIRAYNKRLLKTEIAKTEIVKTEDD
ncbi:chloride channel protein [Phosphitispora sp. TUW77]|uniref:chloride channel protein n=1 Tax=Phosphitispora sp. TUW77 TaxID=3152361 RepID=UPI003AB2CFE1